ncbi:trehalose biosynthesis protein [soil metagenome]
MPGREQSDRELIRAIAPWLITQRWYSGKGRAPSFELVASIPLPAPSGCEFSILLILDHAKDPLLYQVPLSAREAPLPSAAGAVGVDAAGRTLYDGAHDPALVATLFGLIGTEGLADGTRATLRGCASSGSVGGQALAPRVLSSRVLSGEQSNTSIVIATAAGPVVLKLFRTLHDGENPDVVLTEALAGAGSSVAPRPFGHLIASWPDAGLVGAVATGHLAFAEEYLEGARDAWTVATAALAAGEDFAERAFALGARTAEMHEGLAAALPTTPSTASDMAAVLSAMNDRYEAAVRAVPGLEDRRGIIGALYRAAAESPWPSLQRIHGDLHLGQVLDAPGRGWVLLDFEGEPLRPMRQRSHPDLPLRDVASMLRSFDYVEGAAVIGGTTADPGPWVAASRRAYVDGYDQRSGRDLRAHHALLDAFELDKALYEVVYETRNRPAWTPIPMAGVDRLIRRHSTPGHSMA